MRKCGARERVTHVLFINLWPGLACSDWPQLARNQAFENIVLQNINMWYKNKWYVTFHFVNFTADNSDISRSSEILRFWVDLLQGGEIKFEKKEATKDNFWRWEENQKKSQLRKWKLVKRGREIQRVTRIGNNSGNRKWV